MLFRSKLVALFEKMNLEIPKATDEQYEELKGSVNLVRLKNHPIELSEDSIDALYHKILGE